MFMFLQFALFTHIIAVYRAFCVILAFETSTGFAVIWFIQGLVQGGTWLAFAKIAKQVSFTLQCTARNYRIYYRVGQKHRTVFRSLLRPYML